MRAPRRKRTMKREIYVPPDTDLDSVASRARYTGSPEHNDFPSFAGSPSPRPKASLCPPEINDQNMVTRWLRDSIRKGITGKLWEGDFPRYVWRKQGDTVYEGRLVNRRNGEYKGYPLRREQWPRGIEGMHDQN